MQMVRKLKADNIALHKDNIVRLIYERNQLAVHMEFYAREAAMPPKI